MSSGKNLVSVGEMQYGHSSHCFTSPDESLTWSILWRLKDSHGIKSRAFSFSTKLRTLIHCVSWCKHSNSHSVKILSKNRQRNSNSQHAQHTLNDQITFWQVLDQWSLWCTWLLCKWNQCLNHSCTYPKQQKEVVPAVTGTREGQNKLTTPFCPQTHRFQPSKCSVVNSLVPTVILDSGEMTLSCQQHLHISSYSIIKESVAVAPGKLHGLLQEQSICNTKFPLHQLSCFPWNTTYLWQAFVLSQKYKVQTTMHYSEGRKTKGMLSIQAAGTLRTVKSGSSLWFDWH